MAILRQRNENYSDKLPDLHLQKNCEVTESNSTRCKRREISNGSSFEILHPACNVVRASSER